MCAARACGGKRGSHCQAGRLPGSCSEGMAAVTNSLAAGWGFWMVLQLAVSSTCRSCLRAWQACLPSVHAASPPMNVSASTTCCKERQAKNEHWLT
jgi:hypothetical protein